MPDERKTQQLDISITGSVDSSLARAIGVTETQLAKLKDAVNTINKGFSKEAFGGFEQVNKQATELESSLHRIGETAAGVTLGEAFMSGLEHAAELIKQMVEGMIEFGKQSLEVRAGREVLQNQLKAMLESLGKQSMGPQIDMLIRNMEGRQTMIRYDQLMKTVNLLLSSAPQRFAGLDAIQKMLSQLSDVSKDVSTFDLATHALTRILAEGKVDAQHLNELSIDTGYAFKKAMADSLKVTPEELSDMMKKHQLPGDAAIDALLKAFDIITGPGGAAYKHAEAQLSGLEGLWARFLGHWADFQESFGKQLETFIQPLAEAIFKHLTPAELTHAFDGLDTVMKDFGTKMATFVDTIAAALAKVDLEHLSKALSSFGDTLTKVFGISGTVDQWQKILQGLADALTSIVNLTKKVVNAFSALAGGLDALDKWVDAHSLKWNAPATEEEKKAAETRSAEGGRIETPKRSNYVTDTDYQRALDIYNKKPHMAEGGVVTQATSLIAGEHGPEAILPLAVLRDHPLVRLTEESIKIQGTETEATVKLTDTINKLTDSISTMQANMAAGGMGGMGGGVGLGSGYGGGGGMTEYGASVPGDQPGGATYDWNSYHGIGAFTQHLVPGQDVAMHQAYARSHYGIAPLGFFVSDKDHMRHRWADVSGSKDPGNEDLYKGALGGLITRPTKILAGERGPEALVPLAGGGGGLVTLHYSPTIHGFGDVAGLLREHADELLAQVEHALSTRFAAMAAV